jgi:hypothetical protein
MLANATGSNSYRARLLLLTVWAIGWSALSPSSALAATPAPPKDPADLAYTAAAESFLKTYRQSGMLGAAGEVEGCYKRAANTFQFSCVALDSMAYVMGEAWAQNGYPVPMASLEYPVFAARVKKQLRIAGMKDDTQMNAYVNALVQRSSVALADASERTKADPPAK